MEFFKTLMLDIYNFLNNVPVPFYEDVSWWHFLVGAMVLFILLTALITIIKGD